MRAMNLSITIMVLHYSRAHLREASSKTAFGSSSLPLPPAPAAVVHIAAQRFWTSTSSAMMPFPAPHLPSEVNGCLHSLFLVSMKMWQCRTRLPPFSSSTICANVCSHTNGFRKMANTQRFHHIRCPCADPFRCVQIRVSGPRHRFIQHNLRRFEVLAEQLAAGGVLNLTQPRAQL
jgi:hypothetical protein